MAENDEVTVSDLKERLAKTFTANEVQCSTVKEQ